MLAVLFKFINTITEQSDGYLFMSRNYKEPYR
jgi:hypothetical protein